ncbi:dipeptide/oligopeptide/nickel ABC transporter permease/ATP-binding protein [Acidisoma sp.]|uniref:dipeptide/oligopeptide/nickel ABC transporter permease/ATP-binding protein n=1 Tax=Acidisoma sp. TaxID=1872115 RepID=UPI003B009089
MSGVTAEVSPARVDSRPGALGQFGRNRVAVFGAVLIGVIAVIALAAPILPLANPDTTDLARRMAPPFSHHALLGTDDLGRDMLSRLVWGTRVSLVVGVVAAFIAATIGSTIGILAAYYGRFVDTALMRGIDMLMAFPYLLLALAIVAVLGPSLTHAMIAIVIVNVPFFARTVRGTTVGLRRADFMAAARLSGQSSAQIIAFELFPNVLPVVVVTASTSIGWMILETAGLSFLGLGAQPPMADLGGMLGDGRNLLEVAPHVATIPGIAILLIAVGVNLLGDGVRDILDPRLKSGGLARIRAATEVAPRADRLARLPPEGHEQGALLQLRGLDTRFRVGRSVWNAVNQVDMVIRPGEAIGIVGESGSGKTVTALSILGLVASPPGRIDGGEILFNGEDLLGLPAERLRAIRGDRIAYVFQDPLTTLNPLQPVGVQVMEAITTHQRLGRRDAWGRAVALLEAVGIPEPEQKARAYPHELSGGQRQRIGIAMALANQPDLVVADEPTTALDVTTQARVLKLLAELRRKNDAAMIFISHDFGVVADLCDRVYVMYGGRVVESGPVRDVLQRPAHPYTARLLACVPRIGQGRHSIQPIPGLPPPTNALPPGCAFAPRCNLAIDACRSGDIALAAVGTEHAARCLRSALVLAEGVA